MCPAAILAMQPASPSQPKTSGIRHAVYLELFGPSNMVGVAFDSRFNGHTGFGYRAGLSYFKFSDSFFSSIDKSSGVFVPLELNYLTGKRYSHLELGAGIGLGINKQSVGYVYTDFQENKYRDGYYFYHEQSAGYGTRYYSSKRFGYYLFGSVGYRYQRP